MGEWENGRMGEWENGGMGEWGNGRMGDGESFKRGIFKSGNLLNGNL